MAVSSNKHWRVLCSQDTKLELRLLSRFFGVKVLLTSVMDKLKAIENAISENDLKRIDELQDCLQRQLQEARSRDKFLI